ncbi:hypothetical protein [Histidinibacterium lentulum]|uniref:Sulfotransferase family protein n=1 Tax=Histidinibacterium lentulum TaxID=2480588 RepID=A0A3N2R5J2_9RHOB|nr:hypothetical protein [Histidinibacterium lentulum]ROU02673.1 hypothetical protein EAT49_10140 [Histidinibacterium lentulum]
MAVHLGAHKTASTHFQKGLRRGGEAFVAAGAALYTPPELRRAGEKLKDRLGLSFVRGGRRKDWSPEMLARTARGHGRLVLSEENILGQMSGTAGRPEARLYPQAGARVAALSEAVAPLPLMLFLTIREPAGFLASAWSQSLYGGYGESFETFAGRIPLEGVDWCGLVECLLAAPRVAGVTVWRKEDYPAVAVAAANALAGAEIAREDWFDHAALHRGLSARGAAHALAAPRGRARAKAAGEARRLYPTGPDNPPFRPFDDELTALGAEFYAAQWRRLRAMPQVRCLEPARLAPAQGG